MKLIAQKLSSGKALASLFVLTTLGILVCTLWPFDFFASNRVSWLESGNGARIGRRGLLVSPIPVAPFSTLAASDSFTLELWVKPEHLDSMYTIVDIFQQDNRERFRIQQYYDSLVVSHNLRGASGGWIRTKMDVGNAFQGGKSTLVTVTSGKKGTSVYFDGKHARSVPTFVISPRELSGRLVLGTSAFHLEPWFGDVYGLAIYPREFSADEVAAGYHGWTNNEHASNNANATSIAKYEFSEHQGNITHNQVAGGAGLLIPKYFNVPAHSFFTPPWLEFDASWSFFWDVVRNIVGFMPFGFFLCALLERRGKSGHAVLWSTLAGGMLSFSVEFLQAYIPQRESGITDIITNTSGAAVGALLLRWELVRRLMALKPAEQSPAADSVTAPASHPR